MKKMFVGVGVTVIAAVLVFALFKRDARLSPPVRTGHFWAANTDGSWLIAYVTSEERGRQRALTSGRNASYTTDHYYRYRLTVRKLPEGALVKEVMLGDVLRNQNRPEPQIVGVVGDVLWLWDGTLAARSLADLAIRCDETALRKTDPVKADLFPREAKQFKLLESPAGLAMRGRDARFYRINPTDFALTPFAATDLPRSTFSTQPENWFDFITTAAEGRTMTSPFNQMTRIALDEKGTWLGLLSDSEVTQLSKWVSHENRPSGEVARSLYRTTYTRDDRYAIIDPKAAQRMGDGSFVQGGVILRHGWTPWQMREPDSVLVLSKRRLGATEPWHVTRLGYDGQSVWTTDTGLADPHEFLDVGPYLFVAGRRPRGPAARTNEDGQRALWIDERTGAKTTLLVSTGDVVQ